MSKVKWFLLALALVFCLPVMAYAQPTIERMDIMADLSYFDNLVSQPIVGKNQVSEEWVQEELDYLISELPSIAEQDWKIYIVPQRCRDTETGQQLAGLAFSDCIYIFVFDHPNQKNAAYITAHEIGHLVHDTYLFSMELEKYGAWRLQGRKATHYEEPAELFAEDFRMLYGSAAAREVDYWPYIEKPNEDAALFMWGRIEKDTVDGLRKLMNRWTDVIVKSFDKITDKIVNV